MSHNASRGPASLCVRHAEEKRSVRVRNSDQKQDHEIHGNLLVVSGQAEEACISLYMLPLDL